jgi:hypothetical protein
LNDKLPDLIQVGNEIAIRLGYDGDFVDEFKGYVTNIGSRIPVEIQCEDLMWQLKQTEVSKVWKKVRLSEILKQIIPSGTPFELNGGDRDLGELRLNKVSVAGVLDKFRSLGITSYVRNGKLYCGDAYPTAWRGDGLHNVRYHFQKNIIEHDLQYRNKKDVKVKLEVISKQNNGDNQTYTYPDNIVGEAEHHTLHQQNGLSKEQLKKIAEAEYSKFVYDGFRGSFLTFGSPYCDHGWVAELEDLYYPEHNGKYLIDKVVTHFGLRGYKRELTLGGAA